MFCRVVVTLDDSAAFENTLDIIQDQTVKLQCAISAVKYLTAWLTACELRRVLERAALIAGELTEVSAREDAMRRLAELRAVADRVLALAPTPSSSAIRQARSSDWNADRSDWEREEQQWAAVRKASRLPPAPSLCRVEPTRLASNTNDLSIHKRP